MSSDRCGTCTNRGRVPPKSQDSYCDSCIWQGESWRKDHYAPQPDNLRDAGPAPFGGRNAGLKRSGGEG